MTIIFARCIKHISIFAEFFSKVTFLVLIFTFTNQYPTLRYYCASKISSLNISFTIFHTDERRNQIPLSKNTDYFRIRPHKFQVWLGLYNELIETVGLQMISEEKLFLGTQFGNRQHQIYMDITSLVQEFPTIEPYNFRSQQGNIVLLQGKIPMIEPFGRRPCLIPINMSLPPNFPNAPPVTQVPMTPGIMIQASEAVMPDGMVRSEYVCQWVPLQSTLLYYVAALSEFFSRYPPVPPQALGTFMVDVNGLVHQGMTEANQLVGELNWKIAESARMEGELAMTKHYKSVVARMCDTFAKQVGGGDNLPEVPIADEVVDGVKAAAKHAAFAETLKCMQDAFAKSKLSLDELIKATRDFSRTHFENEVLPVMKST